VELIERGKLKTAHIRAVVIDEADRLLNDESLDWIHKIVSAAPPSRQLIFASATIEQQTREVLKTLAPDVLMLRGGSATVNKNIEHLYLICDDRTNQKCCASSSTRSKCHARSCSCIARRCGGSRLEVNPSQTGRCGFEFRAVQEGPEAGDGWNSQRHHPHHDCIRPRGPRTQPTRRDPRLQSRRTDHEQGLSA